MSGYVITHVEACGCKVVAEVLSLENRIIYCGGHAATFETMERMGRELEAAEIGERDARHSVVKLENAVKEAADCLRALVAIYPNAVATRRAYMLVNDALGNTNDRHH